MLTVKANRLFALCQVLTTQPPVRLAHTPERKGFHLQSACVCVHARVPRRRPAMLSQRGGPRCVRIPPPPPCSASSAALGGRPEPALAPLWSPASLPPFPGACRAALSVLRAGPLPQRPPSWPPKTQGFRPGTSFSTPAGLRPSADLPSHRGLGSWGTPFTGLSLCAHLSAPEIGVWTPGQHLGHSECLRSAGE